MTQILGSIKPEFACIQMSLRPVQMCCGAVFQDGGRRLVWTLVPRLLELQRVESGRERERGRSSEVGTAEWCARSRGGRFFFSVLENVPGG